MLLHGQGEPDVPAFSTGPGVDLCHILSSKEKGKRRRFPSEVHLGWRERWRDREKRNEAHASGQLSQGESDSKQTLGKREFRNKGVSSFSLSFQSKKKWFLTQLQHLFSLAPLDGSKNAERRLKSSSKNYQGGKKEEEENS